jgi:hypothetical protein
MKKKNITMTISHIAQKSYGTAKKKILGKSCEERNVFIAKNHVSFLYFHNQGEALKPAH